MVILKHNFLKMKFLVSQKKRLRAGRGGTNHSPKSCQQRKTGICSVFVVVGVNIPDQYTGQYSSIPIYPKPDKGTPLQAYTPRYKSLNGLK